MGLKESVVVDSKLKKNKIHILNNYIDGDPFDEENLIDSLRIIKKLRAKNSRAIIEARTNYWIAAILKHPFRKRLAQYCDYIIDKTLWKESSIKHIWKNENNRWTNVTYEI